MKEEVSAITASPIASDFKAIPGPLVDVAPSEPEKEAPIAVQIPANFVFSLKHFNAPSFILGKILHNFGSRSYGIASEE